MPRFNEHSALLFARAIEAGITSPQELANLMGNASVETGQFGRMHENLNYRSANAIIAAVSSADDRFTRQEIDDAVASRDPQRIATILYENRADLGNTEPGDGYRYHGRGFLQFTGRDNYTRYGERFGMDLAGNPDQAADPETAARLAIAYWRDRVPETARTDAREAGRIINGGDNGADARVAAAGQWARTITPELVAQVQRGELSMQDLIARGEQPTIDPLADGVLSAGERGAAVQQLQRSLNTLGMRDDRGNELETRSGIYGDRTAEAVRRFQAANGLEQTGSADQRTREAIDAQLRQHGVQTREQAPQPAQTPAATGSGTWPAPGNHAINQADRPGEGRGEWNSRRPAHRDGDGHDGVDIQGQVGDPVVAFRGGTARAFSSPSAGNFIVVDHGDGTSSRYLHLDSMRVRAGQTFEVREGEQIGTMGRSGNTPRQGDTHLHFEYRVNGRDVDPMPYLDRASRDGTVREGAPPVREAATPPASRAMADGVLKAGDRGAEVIALQERLNALGYRGRDGQPLENRSGIFGPDTEHALRDFQRAHGLEVDGKAGQRETLPALERAGRQPLVSEATHPSHGMFAEVGRRLAEQTGQPVRPEAVANITQQMLQNGFRSAEDIRGLAVRGTDVHVQGPLPGSRVSIDLNAPTADMQAMSDYMSRETQEQQQLERQRQQQQSSPVMAA